MGVLAADHDIGMPDPDMQWPLKGPLAQHAYQLAGAQAQRVQPPGQFPFCPDGLNFRRLARMELVQGSVHVYE